MSHWVNEVIVTSSDSIVSDTGIVLIQAASRHSPVPHICSSHFLTHVSWGAGILHATVTSSFFVCRTAHSEWVIGWMGHWMNESIGEWVIGWMKVLVNKVIGWMSHWLNWSNAWMDHWMNGVIGWIGHWMNEGIGEWVIGWMSHWMNEGIGKWGNWVNGSLNEWGIGEWVIGWMGHWMNVGIGEWVTGWMRSLLHLLKA